MKKPKAKSVKAIIYSQPPFDSCPQCDGIGSVCQACGLPINECECLEDSDPCLCERCNGYGKVLLIDEGGDDGIAKG